MKTVRLISFFSCMLSFAGVASDVHDTLPDTLTADSHVVFYSHGYIVEGDNPTPVDTRFGWGLYDFPAIKAALADSSYTLVATHRPKNTDPFDYATKMSDDIRSLIDKGIDPKHITIVGFSRGAFITGLTSNHLSDFGVNTVILAGCGRLIAKQHDDIKVSGHVLSIYENSDRANTCKKLKDKSPQALSFEEIEINTGLEHGAFYRPIQEWVTPVKTWIKTRHSQ